MPRVATINDSRNIEDMIAPATADACFCQVRFERILEMARRRYVDRIPTIELLSAVSDPEGRKAVALVSLLDVDEGQLEAALASQASHGDCNLVACRRMLAMQVARSLDLTFDQVVNAPV